MTEEQIILVAERLRDDLNEFKLALRGKYKSTSQVTSEKLRQQAASLAEKWLVELGTDDVVNLALGDPIFADLNVHFQRLLTFSEHATVRSRYDAELRSILSNYSTNVVLPLKQLRGKNDSINREERPAAGHSVFVGQSFDPSDLKVNGCICDALSGLGLSVARAKGREQIASRKR